MEVRRNGIFIRNGTLYSGEWPLCVQCGPAGSSFFSDEIHPSPIGYDRMKCKPLAEHRPEG
jgi:hypothetical protein